MNPRAQLEREIVRNRRRRIAPRCNIEVTRFTLSNGVKVRVDIYTRLTRQTADYYPVGVPECVVYSAYPPRPVVLRELSYLAHHYRPR